MLKKVHVLYGLEWAVECKTRASAMNALALCDSEGVLAEYKHTLKATYALVVEYYPRNAGLGDGPRSIRRYKWAYSDGWVDVDEEGNDVPSIYNSLTGEMVGFDCAKRSHSATATHAWYTLSPPTPPTTATPSPNTSQRSVGYTYSPPNAAVATMPPWG